MTRKPVHVAIGNINIDISFVVDRIPGPDEAVKAREAYIGPGGAASNYSVAATAAGHAARLAARTGPLAEQLGVLESLRRRGVDTSLVRVIDDALPGIVVVLVSRGERSMVKLPGANAFLDGSEAEGPCDVLHGASISPTVYLEALRRSAARLASYDPGSYALSMGPRLLEYLKGSIGILYLNRAEFRAVTGAEPSAAAAAELAKATGSTVVVKMGSRGALAAQASGAVYMVEALRVDTVVDTTGAGDVFAAYMNAWLVEGRSVGEALQAAAAAAGLKVSRRGAQSAPNRKEVEEILSSRPPRLERART